MLKHPKYSEDVNENQGNNQGNENQSSANQGDSGTNQGDSGMNRKTGSAVNPNNNPAQFPAAVTAAIIVDELLRLGMRDAVVCPGSRSAPLARALVHAADEGKVRLHVRIDERSAAFLALGLAAATSQVTPVITTSGTAVANLAPAMVEAYQSGIPLLALTADRPASYRGTNANQTINQDRLFADCSVVEIDIDGTQMPSEEAAIAKTAAALRGRIDRVVAAMRGGTRLHSKHLIGSGHINVRFVEPLVPPEEVAPAFPEGRADGGPWTQIANFVDPHGASSTNAALSNTVPATIDISRRTLVIAGTGAPDLPELEELPTIAEPNAYATASAPVNPVHPLAAGTFAQIPPAQIIVLGRPTLHRGVAKLLANPDIDVTIVAPDLSRGYGMEYPDVTANARRVVADVKVVGKQDEQWLKICEAASELALKAVREALNESIESGAELTGFEVAAALTDSLRTGDQVIIGASNPIRDVSYTGLPFAGVRTYAGRGAAGIDGTVATAIGFALASDREHADEIRPPRTIALMGDLTFQHDSAALAIGPLEPRPENLTIVVANDSGGGIFETLEPGAPALRGNFERIFGTPQDIDFAALCEAYGITYELVATLPDLLATLHPDTDVDGIRVVEVKTTRSVRRNLHQKLAYNAELDV